MPGGGEKPLALAGKLSWLVVDKQAKFSFDFPINCNYKGHGRAVTQTGIKRPTGLPCLWRTS